MAIVLREHALARVNNFWRARSTARRDVSQRAEGSPVLLR